MKIRQNWIFYGINNDATIILAIKTCVDPGKTKEYKNMMKCLDNYVYERVGAMTADEWNRNHVFVKFNSDINLI